MSLQIDLFASAEQLVNNVYKFADERLHPDEKPRLNRQCIEILKAFCAVPNSVSNFELANIAIRYSARIYDLRKAGIHFQIVGRDHLTGEVLYHFDTPEDRERAKGYL